MAEKWLIDANSICRGCPSYTDCKGECWSEGECEIYDVLVKAPTVDAVEVVRCKDCKRCDGFPGPDVEPNEVGICEHDRMMVKPDHFCGYGERKDDEKENC